MPEDILKGWKTSAPEDAGEGEKKKTTLRFPTCTLLECMPQWPNVLHFWYLYENVKECTKFHTQFL